MKKFRFGELPVKFIVSAIIILCGVVLFEKLLSNANVIAGGIGSLFGFLQNMLTPFIFGFTVAYLLNPAVRFFEIKVILKIKNLFKRKRARRLSFNFVKTNKKPPKNRARLVATGITYLLLAGCIVWIIVYLIPELIESTRSLITNAISGQTADGGGGFLNNWIASVNEALSLNFSPQDLINMMIEPVTASLSSVPDLLGRLLAGTVNAAYILVSFFIGLMISFYMMLEKENIRAAVEKFLNVAFKRQAAETIIQIAKNTHYMFEKFFIGKIAESVVVAVIFFITCLFVRPPYVALLTLIVGVTNMIPYFGPWAGGAIVVLIVIIRDPVQALWLGVIILILQQVDAAVIAPKILGDSTGLKPLDVIFAIFAGGALFGVPGMFLGVPVYSVIKSIVVEIINRKYRTKFPADAEESPP